MRMIIGLVGALWLLAWAVPLLAVGLAANLVSFVATGGERYFMWVDEAERAALHRLHADKRAADRAARR